MSDKALEALAQETGLRYDGSSNALYGYYNGYHVHLGSVPGNASIFALHFSVSRGTAPSKEDLTPLVNGCKAIARCNVEGYGIDLTVKSSAWSRKKTLANAKTALAEAAAYLRRNGYEDCCQGCGQYIPTETYIVGGKCRHLCASCYQTASAGISQQAYQEQQKAENHIGGIVGALLGSLLGVLVMVLLDQLGYVAALSGIVMAVCTLKGYELLGGKLSVFGMIISIVIMAAMVYVGNQITWALAFLNELKGYADVTFFDCFRSVSDLLDLIGDEAWSSYTTSLVQQYLFVAIGAVPTIISSRRNRKIKNSVRRAGAPEQ